MYTHDHMHAFLVPFFFSFQVYLFSFSLFSHQLPLPQPIMCLLIFLYIYISYFLYRSVYYLIMRSYTLFCNLLFSKESEQFFRKSLRKVNSSSGNLLFSKESERFLWKSLRNSYLPQLQSILFSGCIIFPGVTIRYLPSHSPTDSHPLISSFLPF